MHILYKVFVLYVEQMNILKALLSTSIIFAFVHFGIEADTGVLWVGKVYRA